MPPATPVAAAPASPEPAEPPVAVTKPDIIRKVTPQYPQLARQSHITGTVKVQVTIAVDGHVRDATVVSGNEILAPAAVEAVKQWLYTPIVRNGRPVEATTVVQFDFRWD